VSDATLVAFQGYEWPGNVRELENLVKRMVVLDSEDVGVETLERRQGSAVARAATAEGHPTASAAASAGADPWTPLTNLKDIGRTAAREAERVAILAMLERTRWNRKEAAEILGISYKALLYKIKDNRLDEAS
jgi:two-component system response regulator AtoC